MTDRKSMRVKNKQNRKRKCPVCVLGEGEAALLRTPGTGVGQS